MPQYLLIQLHEFLELLHSGNTNYVFAMISFLFSLCAILIAVKFTVPYCHVNAKLFRLIAYGLLNFSILAEYPSYLRKSCIVAGNSTGGHP